MSELVIPFLLFFREGEIQTMATRVKLMRQELNRRLKALGCPGNWDHIISQRGMFSYTGLNGN